MKNSDKKQTDLHQKIDDLKVEIRQKDQLIELLQYRIDILMRTMFASRSEGLKEEKPSAPDTFDEANEKTQQAQPELIDTESADESETITVSGHTRKKKRRKPLPENLPRITHEIELPADELTCTCGCQLTKIGEVPTEKLEVIPAIMYVNRYVRFKYACKKNECMVKTAELPACAIPKSNAGPSLLAHIIVSKFCDHLPLYRQEYILKRCDIEITRATLCNWVLRSGELVTPLINLLQDKIREYDIAYADETKIQVLKEPGRKADTRSYMWLFGGGPPEQFAWVYQYHQTRKGQIALDFFEDFKGYLHVDGYVGYKGLEKKDVTLVGCLAHARRRFFKVFSAGKKKKGLAYQALLKIKEIYKLESDAKKKELTPEQLYELRQAKALPLLNDFKKWCDDNMAKVPPKSPLGDALSYTRNQWEYLIKYVKDGRLEIDNNRSERSIKPFVMGRKNWLFNDKPEGATAAANLYSLIETCKAHKIDPYAYLRYIMIKLPLAQTAEDYEALLPFNCDRNELTDEIEHLRRRLGKVMAESWGKPT